MSYQKVYMNQIHSSSLLCQLAQMWKTQLLCDAVIKTGSVITKAHRVVLVAACPMLQSMNDATSGSHLEVRLAADIKQDSINTFLQYLYEGFMMLTEENVQDVEKVARLLQVDGIIKCCADFNKCIQSKTGVSSSQYKYTFNDLVEFRHVRVSDLQKTMQERMMKRSSEMSRPSSPGNKRPRMHHPASPDDTSSMKRGYYSSGGGGGPPDPWDRVPQLGSGMSSRTNRSAEPGVIEIMEESIELVQTDPPDKSRGSRPDPKSLKSTSISVASQYNTETDLRVINVSSETATNTTSVTGPISSSGQPSFTSACQRGSITVSPLTLFGDSPASGSSISSSHQKDNQYSSQAKEMGRQDTNLPSGHRQSIDSLPGAMKQRSNEGRPAASPQRQQQPYPVSMPVPAGTSSGAPQSKPYAVGSAIQAGDTTSSMSPNVNRSSAGQSRSQPVSHSTMSPSFSSSVSSGRGSHQMPPDSRTSNGSGGDRNIRFKEESDISSTADLTPDLSIVKVESSKSAVDEETGGLDMYVDTSDGAMHLSHIPDDDVSDQEYEAPGEWGQESNEGSNISGDQNSWMASASGSSFQDWHRDTSVQLDYIPQFTYLSDFEKFRTVESKKVCKIDRKNKSHFTIENIGTHKLVHIEGRKKVCRNCSKEGRKTAKGYAIETSFKCELCNLALCRVGCFTEFHNKYMIQ